MSRAQGRGKKSQPKLCLYFYVHLSMYNKNFMRPVTLPSLKTSNVRLKFCSSVSANHLNPTMRCYTLSRN